MNSTVSFQFELSRSPHMDGKLKLAQSFNFKENKIAHTFAMVYVVREITAKRSYKCDKYGLFEH